MIALTSTVRFQVNARSFEGKVTKIDAASGYAWVECPEYSGWRAVSRLEEVPEASVRTVEITAPEAFTVDDKFNFLATIVGMVARGLNASCIVFGEGGLGKSYTVMQELSKHGVEKDVNCKVVKGSSTARGLFNTLRDNSDATLVFDDCDDVIKDPQAVNILKAALDSYNVREVSWQTAEGLETFVFTGKIVFISNMPKSKVPQPLLSRSFSIDLTLSADEKIERMRSILPNVEVETDMAIRERALALLSESRHKVSLSMRSLLKTIRLIASGAPERQVKFMLANDAA